MHAHDKSNAYLVVGAHNNDASSLTNAHRRYSDVAFGLQVAEHSRALQRFMVTVNIQVLSGTDELLQASSFQLC